MRNATHAAAKHHVQATRSFVHLCTQMKGYESRTRSRTQRESPVHRNAEWHPNGTFSRDGVSALYRRWDVCGAPIGRGDSLPMGMSGCCCWGTGVALCMLVARRDPMSGESLRFDTLYICGFNNKRALFCFIKRSGFSRTKRAEFSRTKAAA